MAYRMVYLRIQCRGYDPGTSGDRDRRNSVGKRFATELVAQLLQEGRLVAAETGSRLGIRSATAKELQNSSRSAEQIEGQITMT